MWLDGHIVAQGGRRLSDERVCQAADTGADTLAVSCPYELLALRGRRQGRRPGGQAEGPRHHRTLGRIHGLG